DYLRNRQAARRDLPGDERHAEAAAAENRDAHAPDITVAIVAPVPARTVSANTGADPEEG
ncbi:MAG TPA: hypothetical protein VF223_22360, partial [Trebonia sp.]